MPFSIIDIILFVIIFVICIRAAINGFLDEVFGLGSFVIGGYLAFFLTPYLQPHLAKSMNETLARVLSFLLLFIIVFLFMNSQVPNGANLINKKRHETYVLISISNWGITTHLIGIGYI